MCIPIRFFDLDDDWCLFVVVSPRPFVRHACLVVLLVSSCLRVRSSVTPAWLCHLCRRVFAYPSCSLVSVRVVICVFVCSVVFTCVSFATLCHSTRTFLSYAHHLYLEPGHRVILLDLLLPRLGAQRDTITPYSSNPLVVPNPRI